MLQSAERFLREIAPDDLDDRGCYVVSMEEIKREFPELRRENVLAYTSQYLSTALQPWLENQGRWVGDGFATIVMRQDIPSWREVLGIVTHELAHWITSEPFQQTDQRKAFFEVAKYAATDNSKSQYPPWLHHGRDFCRASAHLAARAVEVVEAVRPSLVRFSKQYCDVSEPTMLTLLATEMDYRGSIRELLKQPAPERFCQLWDEIEASI